MGLRDESIKGVLCCFVFLQIIGAVHLDEVSDAALQIPCMVRPVCSKFHLMLS